MSRTHLTIPLARSTADTPPTKPPLPQIQLSRYCNHWGTGDLTLPPSASVHRPRDQTVAGAPLLLPPTDEDVCYCSINTIKEELHLRASWAQHLTMAELYRRRRPSEYPRDVTAINRRCRSSGVVSCISLSTPPPFVTQKDVRWMMNQLTGQIWVSGPTSPREIVLGLGSSWVRANTHEPFHSLSPSGSPSRY